MIANYCRLPVIKENSILCMSPFIIRIQDLLLAPNSFLMITFDVCPRNKSKKYSTSRSVCCSFVNFVISNFIIFRLVNGRKKSRKKNMIQIAKLLDIPIPTQSSTLHSHISSYNILSARHQSASSVLCMLYIFFLNSDFILYQKKILF